MAHTARELRPVPLLMVGNFLSGSGRTRSICEDLAERLRGGGWQVVMTSHRVGRLSRLMGMLSTTYRKRHEYAVAQVDVYSGAAFCWSEAVAWLLRSLGKPYVLSLHGGNLPDFARRWPNRVRRLLHSAAVVTVPSQYLLRQMAAYRAQLRCLPNALDVAAYRHRTRTAARPRLVWARAFSQIYNPVLAPRVVAELRADFPSVRLAMLGPDKGDGSYQQTRAAAETLGVADHIQFTGVVPHREVSRWLEDADIFLNTTHVDNAPLSVLEAMAAGLCVVSTDVGGIPDLIESHQTGMLTHRDDAPAMARAVRAILSDRELAERLSRGAREFAETRDWSHVLPAWQALLTEVARGGSDTGHNGQEVLPGKSGEPQAAVPASRAGAEVDQLPAVGQPSCDAMPPRVRLRQDAPAMPRPANEF